MDLAKRREELRLAVVKAVSERGGDLPVGLVRAVLGEVEHDLISKSDNVILCELLDDSHDAE